ncbi:MAG: hypothetical protein HY512_00785 [Candidatus Aenigmarchaeota archaeon]|nr:hypothetical protein [Candidatus Aenigmarchaeota archaeon]
MTDQVNENSSGWIAAGRKRALDLSWLHQDKEKIYDGLDRLALPRPKTYIFEGVYISSVYVDELFERSKLRGAGFFVRLVPKNSEENRPYREKIFTAEGLRVFCSGYDIKSYRVNLVESGCLTHTGAIVATDASPGVPGRCAIEIAKCAGHEFFHGKIIPTHAEISMGPRTVKFSEKSLPIFQNQEKEEKFLEEKEKEERLALRALRMIGGPKHPFPGYYEFSVWDDRIFFRNYQPQDSVYGSLWLPLQEVREICERLNGD